MLILEQLHALAGHMMIIDLTCHIYKRGGYLFLGFRRQSQRSWPQDLMVLSSLWISPMFRGHKLGHAVLKAATSAFVTKAKVLLITG